MSAALDNVTTGDAYTSAATLGAPRSVRALIHVNNAPVYYQIGRGIGGAPVYGVEKRLLPGLAYSLGRRFDAIRVRSAVAGQPAVVTIDAVTRDEMP